MGASSWGQSNTFCAGIASAQELSAELAGDGGVTMCSADGQEDLTGKESCELAGLGARALGLAWNGLNGPRGKGSPRGRGGRRRSSPTSALDPWEMDRRALGKSSVIHRNTQRGG